MGKIIGFILLIFLLNSVAKAQNGAFLEFDNGLQKAAEQKWDQAGFKNTSIRLVTPSTNFALKSPLTLLVLNEPVWNGTSWTAEEVVHELRIAEKIYARCEVSFGPITLIETQSGLSSMDLETDFNLKSDVQLFKPELLKTRPTVLFKRDGGSYAWLLPDINYQLKWEYNPNWEVLLGTAGISRKITMQYKTNPPPHADYNILAHELAHLLWQTGHLEAESGNILAGEWENKGTHISEEQCLELRKRLSIRGR